VIMAAKKAVKGAIKGPKPPHEAFKSVEERWRAGRSRRSRSRSSRTPEGLLGLLQSFLGDLGKPASTGKPWEDPRWTKACDEVVAAFAAERVRADTLDVSVGEKPLDAIRPNVDSIKRYVKRDLPRAIQIFGHHPADARPCKCRHYSIVSAGAERTARSTGEDFETLVKAGIKIVDRYLASRS